MRSNDKFKKRNLGATVLSSVVTITALMYTIAVYPSNFSDMGSVIFFVGGVIFTLISLSVTIYGRTDTFVDFVSSIFHIYP